MMGRAIFREGYVSCFSETAFGCGPAAVLTCLLQEALPEGGMPRLAELARTTPSEGTSLEGMVEAFDVAAQKKAALITCSLRELCRLALPVIAMTTNRDGRLHYVVVHRFEPENKSLLVADPAKGLCSIPISTFVKRMWTGELILFEANS